MDVSITGIAPDSGTSVRDESDVNALIAGGPATTATIIRKGPNISSAGGATTFEVIANGNWNASIYWSGGGAQGGNTDTGSFTLTNSGGQLSISGGYAPTYGQGGAELIELVVSEEPIYFNPAGNTGLASVKFTGNLVYTIKIYARNANGTDGTELDTASVFQNHLYGGRTVLLPSTWTATNVLNGGYSTSKPSWSFHV
jgi:hypothetical protein